MKTVLAGLNELLSHSGNEIIKVGDKYVVKNISEEIKIDASAIKTVNHDYIQSIYTRGLDDIDKANYDSALTKSRTLMEEAMCYAIEKKGVKPNGSGKIRALYDQFTENYMLHTNQGMSDRMDDFIKKAYDLMESVSVMRDIDGDSHGEGKKRINLEKHQTLLYLNVAIALADFVLSVAKDG
ncbi:MAG: abortive infection family protein [Bacteroidales bacterium]|nr:abortive infection family protein [Bacteroidales bacterium]